MKNESTQETCPAHIWKHEVVMAAVALGADGEACRAVGDVVVATGQTRLSLWYTAGEPVWMAADTLAAMAKECARSREVATGVRDHLRQALAACASVRSSR